MKKNKSLISDKRRRKSQAKYLAGGGDSQYARKRSYCLKHGVWGWEVPYPKPWNRKTGDLV